MGIPGLNVFLRTHCSDKASYKINLDVLSNKTLVIDTSIYLHKYKEQNALLANMYLMISIMYKYKITPIFVFDGKTPLFKKTKMARLLQQQSQQQQQHGEPESQLVVAAVAAAKQVRILDTDIALVKELIGAFGAIYYDAPRESDEMCSFLVNSGDAWACVSDDMDMFVYGCKRVIRHFSLLNENAVFYDTALVLKELRVSLYDFRQIIVFTGNTDYHFESIADLNSLIHTDEEDLATTTITTTTTETMDLKVVWQLYQVYSNIWNVGVDFYEWLIQEGKLAIEKRRELAQICNIFDLSIRKPIDPKKKKHKGKTSWSTIRSLMQTDGFIF